MFEREVAERIKAEIVYKDEELKKILDEAKEVGLKEFEGKKKGSENLCNRSRQQLEEKMEGVMKVVIDKNAERRRVLEEKHMEELVEECSKVRMIEWNDS